MFALFLTVIGISIIGPTVVRIPICRVPITYITMAMLFISYARFFIIKRGKIKLNKGEKSLIAFIFWGLLVVALSFLGVNRLFISNELYHNRAYILRQAFYLAVLPAIILFQDSFYTSKINKIIRDHGTKIFWIVFATRLIISRSLVLGLTTQVVLFWLSLKIDGVKHNKTSLLRAVLMCIVPLGNEGGSTNLLIRLLFIYIYFFSTRVGKRRTQRILGIAIFAMICLTFLLPIFVGSLGMISDVNAIWRVRYWADELSELVKSGFLGVGYGTSYATKSFLGGTLNISSGPFAATQEYTTLDKMFVTGSHSSFIMVAFRLGVLGIFLFLFFLRNLYKEILNRKIFSPTAFFAFCASIIIIDFNVGLESPFYLFTFVFMIGTCIQEVKESDEKQQVKELQRTIYMIKIEDGIEG